MKNVLLLGGANPAHKPRDVAGFVADYLEESDDIEVSITEDTSILESSATDAYDAFLLYLNTKDERWPQRREAAFLDAVTRGKGLLVLTRGRTELSRLGSLLGAHWRQAHAGLLSPALRPLCRTHR